MNYQYLACHTNEVSCQKAHSDRQHLLHLYQNETFFRGISHHHRMRHQKQDNMYEYYAYQWRRASERSRKLRTMIPQIEPTKSQQENHTCVGVGGHYEKEGKKKNETPAEENKRTKRTIKLRRKIHTRFMLRSIFRRKKRTPKQSMSAMQTQRR